MRRVLLLFALTTPDLVTGQGPSPDGIVLNHVTVVDVARGNVFDDMAVLIRASRITAVERATAMRAPSGTRTLDLTGKFVIPGLVDMHNHLGPGAAMPGPPDRNARETSRDAHGYLAQMLGLGFTSVFATSYPNLREHAELRASRANDAAPFARYFGVGRGSSVAGGHASQPRFGGYLPVSADEARANVRELQVVGVDGIKLTYSDQAHTGRPPLAVMEPAIMRAIVDEAHRLGLKAHVHAPTLRHAKEALKAGVDGLVHSIADAPIDDEFIQLMRKNSATYTTTLSLYTAFTDISAWMQKLAAADVRHVVPNEVYERYRSADGARTYHALFGTFPAENLAHARANARRLLDAGVPVLAGTDTGVTGVLLGISSQMELVLLGEAGFSSGAALRAATMNPAKALGREADLGTVEANKLADLVVLDANPLTDIRNIMKVHRVIKGGIVYVPDELLAASK
jgi:imidazolonepropionase-like amidohydrolase